MDIVVVGGGMAGARLAQQLAPYGLGPGGAAGGVAAGAGGAGGAGGRASRTAALTVTVIGEEPHAPYNRVLLAEVLAGRYAADMITLPGAAPRAEPRRVVRLDRAEHTVVCDDGSAVRYDRLVLATGSNPVLPPLRGLFEEGANELPAGVHAFRTMDDCLALASAAGPGTRVVVVGGGLLGVSAAQALAARGAQVVVAQQGEYLMERHLDESAAQLLRTHLESQGVEVHTECRVRRLHTRPDPDGRRTVRAVELADGYCLGADLVVLACGVRPRVGLASAAGLDVAKGIVVDDELRTSDPAIHAIGDCAQHAGVVYGLAGAARDQADVLARVLAQAVTAPPAVPTPDAEPRYTGTRALTRLTLHTGRPANPLALSETHTGTGTETGSATDTAAAGTSGEPPARRRSFDLAAFGDPVATPGDDVLRLADATRGAYRKVIVRGDRLVGGILLGDLAAVGAVASTWEGDEPLPSAPLLHLLTNDGGF
ncbi:FAD-dependent oxidoreductase [Streptomyces sp. NPDC051976]|uniref:NAD(P)/FAD-dependent oxidoreductase n=1 Tax=Streptomyces sp. NPDC051976 TaxID=3154947 RepID=UPI003422F02F